MKSLLSILAAAALAVTSFGASIPGTVVSAKVTRGNTLSTNINIGDTREMGGTEKQVANEAARLALESAVRTEGMTCWQIDTGALWRLVGGIDNTNWSAVANLPAGVVTNGMTNAGISITGNAATATAATNADYAGKAVNTSSVGSSLLAEDIYGNFTVTATSELITNGMALNGAQIVLGTVSSNALDVATKAQLALAGTGNSVTAGVTNQWRVDATNIAGALDFAFSISPTNQVQHSIGVQHLRGAWMGYNNWYSSGGGIGGATTNWIWTMAKALLEGGYVSAGYNTIVFDDGWQAATRDGNGRLQANVTSIPQGMSNFVAQLHAYGIPRIGVYTEPRAITSVGQPGSDSANIELDAQTFADWGIDYVKFDAVNLPADLGLLQRFSTEYIKHRPGGFVNAGITSTSSLDSNTWLIDWCAGYQSSADGQAEDLSGDNLHKLLQFTHSFDSAMNFNSRYGASGVFCSADAIPVNWGDTNQLRYMFSAASVVNTPLQIMQPAAVSDGALYTTFIPYATNREMISIQQDTYGVPFIAVDTGHGASTNGVADPHGYSVFVKPLGALKAGAKCLAVAILNRDTNAPVTVSVNWTNIGMVAGTPCAVRDVWNGTNGYQTNAWSYTLAPNCGALLKVWPLLNEPLLQMNLANGDGGSLTNVPQLTGTNAFSGLNSFNFLGIGGMAGNSTDTLSVLGRARLYGTDSQLVLSYYGGGFPNSLVGSDVDGNVVIAPGGTKVSVIGSLGVAGTASAAGLVITNSATMPTFSTTAGALWNSNSVLYWVTSTKTNVVSDGR